MGTIDIKTEPGAGVTPEEVLRAAYYQYKDAGLRLPPIPREFLDRLENYANWRFGTVDADPSDRAALTMEAGNADTENYLVFGHVGHGVSSWSITCRLVLGHLAVFVRHPWGNAMGDREVDSVPVHKSFYDMEELIVRAENALKSGKLSAGERLVVIQDSIQGSGWQILGRPGETWHKAVDAIKEVMSIL